MCVTALIALAGASLVTAGVSGYMQYEAGQQQQDSVEKQSEAQRKAQELQQQQADLKAQKERIQTVRQARIVAANAEAAAVTQGGEGGISSSSTLGGQGSIESQLGANINYINESQSLGQQASQAVGDYYKFGAEASSFARDRQTIGMIGSGIQQGMGTVFGMADRGGFLKTATPSPAKFSTGIIGTGNVNDLGMPY